MNYDFEIGEQLLFNKPIEWTSFDVVNKVRMLISKKINKKVKVGHAGTLDPLATGLMIICTGKKTKTLNELQDFDKEYIATIKIGATTPSFDLETPEDNQFETTNLTKEKIVEVINSFLGKQEQIPPDFSAKKVDGKRAYTEARKGKKVFIEPSLIEIKNIEVLEFLSDLEVKIKISCSKGTYIRALARDIGLRLENGAYLIALQRTKIGNFLIENSLTIEEFKQKLEIL